MIFERFPPCTWQVGSSAEIVIPVIRLEESGGNRIVKRERPFRNGAKLDDIGSTPKQWDITADFFLPFANEPGVDFSTLYPGDLAELITSFDQHETGTLQVPTVGVRRCRAESYKRVESAEERDVAAVVLTFIEDNEDGATAEEIDSPRGIKPTVEQASFSAKKLSLGEIADQVSKFADDIDQLMAAPGNFVSDIKQTAGKIIGAIARVTGGAVRSTQGAAQEAETLLTKPEDALLLRQWARVTDMAVRASQEKTARAPRILHVKYGVRKSLVDVAQESNQDFVLLMSINSALPDALNIEPGTVVNVFDIPPVT